jgi:tetratricopeptide (TPR) repeat protein
VFGCAALAPARAQAACPADAAAQAVARYAAADYAGAVALFTCAIDAASPAAPDFDAVTGRMQAALFAGRFNQAVADANLIKDTDRARFDALFATYDTNAQFSPTRESLMLRALLLWVDARDDEAIADYDAILALDPGNAFAYLFRGSSLQYLGDRLQPPDDFADAIAAAPGNADVYALIGSTYTQTGDYSAALSYLAQAIALDPGHSRSYYFRGLTYLETREFKLAEEDFTRAIELDPNFSEPYYDRGRVFAQQGDFEQAVLDFSRVIGINAQFRLAYLSRGVSLAQLGRASEAVADLARYAALNQLRVEEGGALLSDLPALAQMGDGLVVRYTLAATQGQTLTVRASSPNNRVDPLLVLLDSAGTPVAANDDEVLGQFVSVITHTAAATDTYTVLLTHSDGGFRGPVDLVASVR